VLGAVGDDTLISAGDGGRDQLIGGLGADTFLLESQQL
jgi:Ca2+-binding RTX toxin-like protein